MNEADWMHLMRQARRTASMRNARVKVRAAQGRGRWFYVIECPEDCWCR